MRSRGRCRAVATVVLALALAGAASATETQWWVVDTAEELLKGRGEGVAVTDDGRLVAVPRWLSRTALEEPVAVAGAVAADGSLLVATGHPARLYRVDSGRATLLAELPGEQATAVLASASGAVLVATVAPGVLLEWSRDGLKEVGRLEQGGFWDLVEVNGTVVAAAGPPASLYRVSSRGLERWAELPDVHARCLAVASDAVVVGTSGKGLIVRVPLSGQVGLLADSPFTEIADLLVAPDGAIWATALVGEPQAQAATPSGGEGGSAAAATGTAVLDLPKVDGATATSEVLRLTAGGALVKVHRFPKQVAAALAWDGDGVLVGTGFEGELWRFVGSGGARLATVDASQVTAIVGGGAAILTQGPAGVLRREEGAGSSRFRSEARRFPRPVQAGEYGVDSAGGGARVRFRAGFADSPNETWLPWSDWLGARGRVPLPPAAALQWEVELVGDGGGGAELERVEVAFRELNLAPRLEKVEVEEPGVVYLMAPPPSGPVVDQVHPDLAGIFTVIDPNPSEDRKPKQGKKFWRVGYRTLSWQAEDPNNDPLRHAVQLERRDGFALPVRERLELAELAVDVSAVPDGLYRFRVTASDELANPGAGLETTALGPWFVVDNTPPSVELARGPSGWNVTVTDAGSSVARVEWSRDGDRWHALEPADGALDGQRESFALPAASGRHLLVVRAVDRHHNRAVASAVEE